MTLGDIANFSTAISGLAVTASLIYLALQTHQSVKHARAQIEQAWTDRVASASFAMAQSDLAVAWLETNGEPATPEAVKRYQFQLIAAARLRGIEDAFLQRREGLVGEERFENIVVGATAMLRQPAFRQFWENWKKEKPGRAREFTAFMDGLSNQRSVIPSE
jgi:hypothetical protein